MKERKEAKKEKVSHQALKITGRRKSVSEEISEDSLSWPQEDIKKLISRMRQHIPTEDNRRHQYRAQILPWDVIAFDDHSGKECQHMWKLILQKIRGFRLLREILDDAEEWLTHPWVNFYASKRKNHHPDRPKKPLSAYMLYFKAHTAKIKAQNPNLKAVDIARLIGERYSNLSIKAKNKYMKKSHLDKEDYERKLEVFLTENPSEKNKQTNKSKKPKTITAFNLFMENQIEKFQDSNDKSPRELLSIYREEWDNLPDVEKIPWLVCAKEKQRELMKFTNQDNDSSGDKVLSKKERKIIDQSNGKPKPPPNIYAMFTRIMMKTPELKSYESKHRMKEISLRWRNLSPEKRKTLGVQFNEEHQNYKELLEEYHKRFPPDESDSGKKSKKRKKNDEEIKNGEEESQIETKKRKTKEKYQVNSEDYTKKNEIEFQEHPDGKEDILQELFKLTEEAVSKKKSTKEVSDSLNTSQDKTRWEGEPKEPPSDPIKMFAKAMKKQKNKYKSDEELRLAWAALAKKERKQYKKALAEAREQYEAKYELFLDSLTTKDRKKFLKQRNKTLLVL